MDNLKTLLQIQNKLQEDLGYNFSTMTKKEKSAYIIEYAMHTDHELHEMLAEIPYFKSWKKYHEGNDYVAAKKEFVDVLHFFLNIALALGFTSNELFDAYMEKHKENYERQASTNYKKCVEPKERICRNCLHLKLASTVNNQKYMSCDKGQFPVNAESTCKYWRATNEIEASRETES